MHTGVGGSKKYHRHQALPQKMEIKHHGRGPPQRNAANKAANQRGLPKRTEESVYHRGQRNTAQEYQRRESTSMTKYCCRSNMKPAKGYRHHEGTMRFLRHFHEPKLSMKEPSLARILTLPLGNHCHYQILSAIIRHY